MKKLIVFFGVVLAVTTYAADGGGSMGRAPIELIYNDNSINNITGAYLTLDASTADTVHRLDVFEDCGKVLVLGVRKPNTSVDVASYQIPPGGDNFDLKIPAGSRISVKTQDGSSCLAGKLVINALK